MESIGEKLSRRREEKHYSLDQAARETHIAKRFIEALETEAFDTFPGESYLVGFLRKYSDYLELDAEEMISLFRNTKIQEQPSPMDELLVTKPKIRWGLIAGISATVVVIGLAAVLLSTLGDPSASARNQGDEPAAPTQPEVNEVLFTAEIIEQEFEENTSIIIPLEENEYRIEIRSIGNPLTLFLGDQSFSLEEGGSGFVDLNRDNDPDLRIVFSGSMENGNPVLRLDKVVAGAFAENSTAASENQGGVDIGQTIEQSRIQPPQTIFEASEPDTFFIEAIFRGPVLLRHLNENGEQVEQFYSSGERFQTEAREYVYFWISNAGKTQFSVAGRNLRLGIDGETAAFRIAWNANRLELIPMY